MPWFVYTSGSVGTATNYILVGPQPTCPGSIRLCAIFADKDGANYPIITMQVLTNIANALNSQIEIPGSVLLKV